MKISGLSIGWGDRLWDQLEPDLEALQEDQERSRGCLQFLRYLESIEGPDLWVGTSHSTLVFFLSDIQEDHIEVPYVACVDISAGTPPALYMISYPLPREIRPWMKRDPTEIPDLEEIKKDCWKVYTHQENKEDAAAALLGAIAVSGTNPIRPQSDWLWYICPNCDLHSPHYQSHCRRCKYVFPPQKKMELLGLFRKISLSEGTRSSTKTNTENTEI
ncbi:hypothetical protein [Gimesia sp.]|uniref:hypothetical protein n=1 Tax=Gimesia sp. TaxID=2024833 RepID=UPI0032EAF48E